MVESSGMLVYRCERDQNKQRKMAGRLLKDSRILMIKVAFKTRR